MWKIANRTDQSLPDDAVLSLALKLANHLALMPAERARLAALIALDEDLGSPCRQAIKAGWALRQ
jgi:hypothetical protein